MSQTFDLFVAFTQTTDHSATLDVMINKSCSLQEGKKIAFNNFMTHTIMYLSHHPLNILKNYPKYSSTNSHISDIAT